MVRLFLEDKINGIIDRYIFQELNEIYTQFMAQELISSEAQEKKKKKKKKSNKKHKKNGKNSEENETCSCPSPQSCEIKPFIDQLTHKLLAEAVDKAAHDLSKRKSKKKKYKKKNSTKNNSTLSNPPLVPQKSFVFEGGSGNSFENDKLSKESEGKNKDHDVYNDNSSLDLKKSQSCDVDHFDLANNSEDFIEVKGKKTKNPNKSNRYPPIKVSKTTEKNNKSQSKFNKPMSENKKSAMNKEKVKKDSNFLEINTSLSTSSLPSKKKTSIDENLTNKIQQHQPQNNGTPVLNKQAKTSPIQTDSIKKSEKSQIHFIDSELEKELKNPLNIHLSKNKIKKEENSSKTLSTKGMDTAETNSPSQKTKQSSSLNGTYLSDEPLLEINLVNIDDFHYESLEDIEDQGFSYKVNNDLNDFLNEMQENAPHIMNFRSLMFQRLLFVVSHIFAEYQPNLRLYGSCATGLALPTSDMDIGITGFEALSSFESTDILQVLLSKLTYLKWVRTYKPIFTATIPVLKLVLKI